MNNLCPECSEPIHEWEPQDFLADGRVVHHECHPHYQPGLHRITINNLTIEIERTYDGNTPFYS